MTTDAATAGQISRSAAEVYDEFFVPALFGAWAAPLCDAAGIKAGNAVLDVACGTGATTREALSRVGPNGRVFGLDRNEGMLDVAARAASGIEWTQGQAEALPFPDQSFDALLCQFGLMFFDDRAAALHEMRRVLKPGGKLAISVWDGVAYSPGYAEMIRLIDEMFGQEAAEALKAPFCLGEVDAFKEVLKAGGLSDASVTTVSGTARFSSIRDWVRMDVRGWTLAEMIDDAGFEALVEAAEVRMARFAGPDGRVAFPAPAHIGVWYSRSA